MYKMSGQTLSFWNYFKVLFISLKMLNFKCFNFQIHNTVSFYWILRYVNIHVRCYCLNKSCKCLVCSDILCPSINLAYSTHWITPCCWLGPKKKDLVQKLKLHNNRIDEDETLYQNTNVFILALVVIDYGFDLFQT